MFEFSCLHVQAPSSFRTRHPFWITAVSLAIHRIASIQANGAPRPDTTDPIRLHPENPHYFLWRNKPTILVSGGEHYGALLNLDFAYVRYLDELKNSGFNLTRIFSGTYREVAGSFNITGNTLAPLAGRFICPWARSGIAGGSDGGNKFDLTKWDEAYFARLEEFLRQAGERGIVVELVLFCTMYDEKVWEASPMNARNHINGTGAVGRLDIYSAKEEVLFAFQRNLAQKLVTELNSFDNVYYEVCNEPYERGGLTKEWNDSIIARIVETEASLPKNISSPKVSLRPTLRFQTSTRMLTSSTSTP